VTHNQQQQPEQQYTLEEIREGCEPLWGNVECMTCSRLLGYISDLLLLLQRVPDEKRMAEIRRRNKVAQDMIKAGLKVEPRLSWEDVDYLLSLLQQPPTASERCSRCRICGHEQKWIANDGTCRFPVPICSDAYHGTRPCGCKCIFPATGATTEDDERRFEQRGDEGREHMLSKPERDIKSLLEHLEQLHVAEIRQARMNAIAECIGKVRCMGQEWDANARSRGAAFSDKGGFAEEIASALASLVTGQGESQP